MSFFRGLRFFAVRAGLRIEGGDENHDLFPRLSNAIGGLRVTQNGIREVARVWC